MNQGADRIEFSPLLGRPIRQGSFAELSVSDRERVLQAIEARDLERLTAYWGYLNFGQQLAKSDFLLKGVSNLDSHMIGAGLSVPSAKAAAAKAACLASVLLNNAGETLTEIRAEANQPQTGDTLVGPYERLRGLRKTAPEAFAYWCVAASYGL